MVEKNFCVLICSNFDPQTIFSTNEKISMLTVFLMFLTYIHTSSYRYIHMTYIHTSYIIIFIFRSLHYTPRSRCCISDTKPLNTLDGSFNNTEGVSYSTTFPSSITQTRSLSKMVSKRWAMQIKVWSTKRSRIIFCNFSSVL